MVEEHDDAEPFGDDIVLCIPGPWVDRSAFLEAVLESSSGRLIAAGGIMLDSETKDAAGFQFEDGVNAHMVEAFEHAGAGRLDKQTLDAIGTHKSVVYLLLNYYGPNGHDGLRRIAQTMRDAGGLGVKIETAGLAMDFDTWLEAIAEDIPAVWYENFVCHVAQDEEAKALKSVGMQQFAIADAVIEGHDNVQDASETLMIFNVYQMAEQPEFQDGQTFSTTEDGPVWQLTHEDDTAHEDDDLFHNPEGVWRLTRSA